MHEAEKGDGQSHPDPYAIVRFLNINAFFIEPQRHRATEHEAKYNLFIYLNDTQ